MKKTLKIVGCALLLSMTTWGQAAEQGLAEKNQQIQAHKQVWIDVRTDAEFQAGHLADALLIPFDEIDHKIAQVAPDKNTPIHLYCRSGHRAGIALNTLKKMGYSQVVNEGAYQDLIQKRK